MWRGGGDDGEAARRGIYHALTGGCWTPQQRQRLCRLGPGTWAQAAADASPGWRGNRPGNPAIEIAIYPDVIRLAAHGLRVPDTRHRAAP
jgi:hypothetical protein